VPASRPAGLPSLRPTPPGARVGRGVRARSLKVGVWRDRETIAPDASPIWIAIVDLNESVCHFPRGDASDLETFRYCGCAIVPGDRYCPGHKRVMYAPRPSKTEGKLKTWKD
jgi:hypothetical protein